MQYEGADSKHDESVRSAGCDREDYGTQADG